MKVRPATKTKAAAANIVGVIANSVGKSRTLRSGDCRSSVGWTTTPLAMSTTTLRFSPDPSVRVDWNVAACWVLDEWHGAVDPSGPSKQATCRIPVAGRDTVARTWLAGTTHAVPFTFQYSSSWSANGLSAFRTA